MATDNITLNQGTGGASVRTLADSSGVEWAPAVACYATTVTPGANVLQVVTPSNGMPVAVVGTVPVSGTFWQATQPVSAASLPLPTGAATAANQAAPGSAGTPSAAVLTVQGIAAMTPLKVDGSAVTQPVSNGGTFPVQSTLQAGTALIGQVAAAHQVGGLYSGTTAVTPQYAAIAASASGATTIVPAQAGKKIVILRWSLSSSGAVNINWQSHATTATATGLHYLTQFASAGGSYCPAGIFATAIGEALDLNLSAAVAVGGELTYVAI